jgi:HD-GYP domain-containing protein (c-di-GMP phosphodiesterase class II)
VSSLNAACNVFRGKSMDPLSQRNPHNTLLLQMEESLRQDSLVQQLNRLHQEIIAQFPIINRIGVALYNEINERLGTYVFSNKGIECPLAFYDYPLKDSVSLSYLAKHHKTRIIQSLTVIDAKNRHAQAIYDAGLRSSYTVPMYAEGSFIGFVFFNSTQENIFVPVVITHLNIIAQLISFLVADAQRQTKTLLAAVKTAVQITHSRDPETGGHLHRMAQYARIIAKQLALKYAWSDEDLDYVLQFAPLHDIGKIRIPDSVLLKQGELTVDERELMKTHTTAGEELLLTLLQSHGLGHLAHVDKLKAVVRSHHERFDGLGYPDGLLGEEIPLIARIVAVADVFDALTSKRPYKQAWSMADACEYLRNQEGAQFDPQCVKAFLNSLLEVEQVYLNYQDDPELFV